MIRAIATEKEQGLPVLNLAEEKPIKRESSENL